MNINISDEAIEYIAHKNGVAKIILTSLGGCCGGAAPIPQIELGEPKDIGNFEKHAVGGVTIYYDKALNYNQLNISLAKLLFMKRLGITFS